METTTHSDTSDNLKKKMLLSMEKSLGVVSVASKQAGISRNTHYRWMKEDPEYKSAIEELENVTLDFAESKLHEQIIEGNVTAIIFFLKTKGKVRGYIERQEVRIQDERPDLSGISTEELLDLVKED